MTHCWTSDRRGTLAHTRALIPEGFSVCEQRELNHADLTDICHNELQGARMIPHAFLCSTEQFGRERDAIVWIGNYLDGDEGMARIVQRLFWASTRNPHYRDVE